MQCFTQLCFLLFCFIGDTRFKRASFIAKRCPSLEIEAYQFAVNEVKDITYNIELYEEYTTKLNAALTRHGKPTVKPDMEWEQTISNKNKLTLEQLERELKNYKNNMIKESIRVSRYYM
jgi:COP9 signalosome complex subunit 1